jgi:hypothetical protein
MLKHKKRDIGGNYEILGVINYQTVKATFKTIIDEYRS